MGKLLKIGFTCSRREKRARELSSATGLPDAFIVEYFQITEDVEEIEGLVHAALSGVRFSADREFFDVTVGHAVDVIQRFIRNPAPNFQ